MSWQVRKTRSVSKISFSFNIPDFNFMALNSAHKSGLHPPGKQRIYSQCYFQCTCHSCFIGGVLPTGLPCYSIIYIAVGILCVDEWKQERKGKRKRGRGGKKEGKTATGDNLVWWEIEIFVTSFNNHSCL